MYSSESTWATFLRFLAAINLIIGIIFSIILALDSGRGMGPIALLLFLLPLLGTLLITVICLTLAEIADNSAVTAFKTIELLRLYEKDRKNNTDTTVQEKSSHPKGTPIKNPNSIATDNGWRCLKCEDKNPITAISCHSCGAYK